jgi:hypothetical protein
MIWHRDSSAINQNINNCAARINDLFARCECVNEYKSS